MTFDKSAVNSIVKELLSIFVSFSCALFSH